MAHARKLVHRNDVDSVSKMTVKVYSTQIRSSISNYDILFLARRKESYNSSSKYHRLKKKSFETAVVRYLLSNISNISKGLPCSLSEISPKTVFHRVLKQSLRDSTRTSWIFKTKRSSPYTYYEEVIKRPSVLTHPFVLRGKLLLILTIFLIIRTNFVST